MTKLVLSFVLVSVKDRKGAYMKLSPQAYIQLNQASFPSRTPIRRGC